MVNNVIDGLNSQVDDICKRHSGLGDNIIDASPSISNISEGQMLENKNFQNIKGIKKRDKGRKGRHPKSQAGNNLRERKWLIMAMLYRATKLSYNDL